MTVVLDEQTLSIFPVRPLHILEGPLWCPHNLLQDEQPKLSQLSPYGRCSSPLIDFVASSGLASEVPFNLLMLGAPELCTVFQVGSYESREGGYFCLSSKADGHVISDSHFAPTPPNPFSRPYSMQDGLSGWVLIFSFGLVGSLAFWAPEFIILDYSTSFGPQVISDQLGASHLSSLNRQCIPKGIILEISISGLSLKLSSLHKP